MAFIKDHDYLGYEILGNVFNISAAASFESENARIVATSGQVGDISDYSSFSPNGTDGQQFKGGHVKQFDAA